MVSSIVSGSSHNAVAQIVKQQNERVDEQKVEQIIEQRRQAQIKLVEETKAAQRQTDADERRGRFVDINV